MIGKTHTQRLWIQVGTMDWQVLRVTVVGRRTAETYGDPTFRFFTLATRGRFNVSYGVIKFLVFTKTGDWCSGCANRDPRRQARAVQRCWQESIEEMCKVMKI
jgi:hypothetical protein